MLKRVLLIAGAAGALVVATSLASPSDSRGPRGSILSRAIGTVTTSDFRAVLTARQRGAGIGAPSADVSVTISQRVGGRWQQTATHRLKGTYFWKTATGPRAVCRLEIRTAGTQPMFRPYVVVQLLVSPALGCGTAQRFSLAREPSSAAVAAGAIVGGHQEVSGTRASCSASSLPRGRAVPGLPPAVASMRLRVIAAARRCDYAALERLGNEVGRGLAFSYGANRSAARFWRSLERNGSRPRPMEALAKVLAMPFARVHANGTLAPRNRARFYVWPSAHRANPSQRDWQALRTLYSPRQIDQMRRAGSYFGYRVGITPAGDWQYFIAGD